MSMLEKLITHKTDYGLLFIEDIPVTHHCHHFNLFLDQTIEDAIGEEESYKLRYRAAHQAFYRLLDRVQKKLNLTSQTEKLTAFSQLFSEMGQGKLIFEADENGGLVKGENLHYSYSWTKKYGDLVRRRTPADPLAAGYIAAVLEHIYNLPFDSFDVKETKCLALRDPHCEFIFTRKEPELELPPLDDIKYSEKPPSGDYKEEEIKKIAEGLKSICVHMVGNELGIVEGFGVFINLNVAEYYNKISYEAFTYIKEKMPAALNMLETLLREAGQVCGFNTMGALMLSPEWESLFGKIKGDPEEIFIGGAGIARALGFGNWTLVSFSDKKVVMRKTTSYEGAHLLQHKMEKNENGYCYLFQGTGEAMMRLAYLVDWNNPPKFDQQFYKQLFKGKNKDCCTVKETKCIGNGDPYCELELEFHF